jgi:hypothetical protein
MAAVKTGPTVESGSAVEAADWAVSNYRRSSRNRARPKSGAPDVSRVPGVEWARIDAWTTPIAAVIPRAGTDEDSAGEPARTVVAIGRACVRIIGIVAVRADRSRSHRSKVGGPWNANPYAD